ncbi:putative PCI domain-containing protein [Rosellinia necatrix]|uniref:Putative PCI domain-containing protein n=1 Tax=Rosellinia necatrix TaxID=77044 RepID=A0A1W2TUA8_ROSNE|nr:putative PCI domain-containing protein [Rosellinia necatrix]
MEQTKALNALEPYLALTKSAAAPRAAADLITQATSNPNTYVFAELLQTPQIQALSRSPDHGSHLKLLEIFSYGTYADYASAAAGLPTLNDAQTLKLRQLSLLTLAKDPRNLSYAVLQRSLGLPSARAVEDLVISAVYAGLVDAQLDPRNGAVHISSVSPLRDLAPGSVPAMLASLRLWSKRCASTLADLDAQVADIRAGAAQRHGGKKAWADQTIKLCEDEKTAEQGGVGAHSQRNGAFLNRALARMQGQRFGKRGSGSLETSADDDEAMDVDDDDLDDGEGGSGSNSAALGGPGKKRANRRKL